MVSPYEHWNNWLAAAPTLVFWFVLIALLTRYALGKSFSPRAIRGGFLLFFFASVASAASLTYLQYQAFKLGPLGKLPQAEFIRYVAGYAELHYWRAWLVGVAVTLVLAAFLWVVKRYSAGLLINQEEVGVAALLGFFAPWPNTAVFFVLAFLLFVFASLVLTLTSKLFPSFFTKATGGGEGDGSFSNLRSGAGMVPDPHVGGGEASLPAGRQGQSESPRRGDERFENEFIPRPLAVEPPRLTIMPFFFISAFLTPIMAQPILVDLLHLQVIFIVR